MDATHLGKCFLRAILAGMAIGIGCCVFLGVTGTNAEYKWVGAILFSIGLFAVFTFGFDLYTGKVGYLVNNKASYLVDLVVIFFGNLVGCLIMAVLMPSDVFLNGIGDKMVTGRLDDIDWFRVFCKGIFCGILMFVAADVYKTKKSYLGAFICVPVFILAGSEHSIADMFYFFSAGEFSVDATLFIFTVAMGNLVGGIIIPFCQKYMYEEAPKKAEPAVAGQNEEKAQ